MTKPGICVIGLGNVLLGDDAFGPLVVETFLRDYDYGPNVEVLDLGTPGLDLAPYMHDCDVLLIADANSDERPGTLFVHRGTERQN